MLLTLMRHGHAEAWAGSDPERRLTTAGERIVAEVVQGLKAGGWTPGAVVCSPFLRARQTASIALELFPGTPLEVLPEVLEPDEGLLERIGAQDLVDPLVVGHEPGLSRLSAALLGARGVIPFQPAAVACMRLDGLPPRRPAELIFFAPPTFARCFRADP